MNRVAAWWGRIGGDGDEQPVDAEPVADTARTVRIGGWLLLAGMAGFLAWASLAPLDEGVPVPGVLTVDTKRKTVQHLTGGLIEKVLVREGQLVNAGDVLIKLDDAQARAEYEGVRHRYLGLRAMENRLEAEQRRQARIVFHPDVLGARGDPLVAQHIDSQEQLLASRRASFKSELDALDQGIESQREAALGFSAQLASRGKQLVSIQEELTGLRDLARDGFVPRFKLLETERLAADVEASSGEVLANLARAQRGAAELTLRRAQRQQEIGKDVDQQLADIRREVGADEQRYRAMSDSLQRTQIRAPVSGSVVGIVNQTVGGVIQAGTRIMDVVPTNEALKLEAHLPPALVDRVRAGQAADIRFNTFGDAPQLVVDGRLESVSADLLSDPATNASYYLARVAVTPQGIRDLGGRTLQPGMPAEVVIKTGERSLLAYLLHPLMRRMAQSMKEQ